MDWGPFPGWDLVLVSWGGSDRLGCQFRQDRTCEATGERLMPGLAKFLQLPVVDSYRMLQIAQDSYISRGNLSFQPLKTS